MLSFPMFYPLELRPLLKVLLFHVVCGGFIARVSFFFLNVNAASISAFVLSFCATREPPIRAPTSAFHHMFS